MTRPKDRNNARNIALLRALVNEARSHGMTHIEVEALDVVLTEIEQRDAR